MGMIYTFPQRKLNKQVGALTREPSDNEDTIILTQVFNYLKNSILKSKCIKEIKHRTSEKYDIMAVYQRILIWAVAEFLSSAWCPARTSVPYKINAMTAKLKIAWKRFFTYTMKQIIECGSVRRGSRGVVTWTCVQVLALGQRFDSNSRRLFCCNPLG